MALRSMIFAGDPVFENCAVSPAGHITPGSIGEHVRKIQGAIEAIDKIAISPIEWATSSYGPVTAAAVLAYKYKRSIINRNYQSAADNIVGQMTIARLDEDMCALETEPVRGNGRSCSKRDVGPPLSFAAMRGQAAAKRLLASAAANKIPESFTLAVPKSAGVVTAPQPMVFASDTRQPKLVHIPSHPLGDGFDELSRFQMVPIGESRKFRISSFGAACTIELRSEYLQIGKFTKVQGADGFTLTPPESAPNMITLAAGKEVTFEVTGIVAGPGVLVVSVGGRVVDSVLISVKMSQTKAIASWLLRSNRHATSTTAEYAHKALSRISLLYKLWANTSFSLANEPTGLLIPKDLGEVIDLQQHWPDIYVYTTREGTKQKLAFDIQVVFLWSIATDNDISSDLLGMTYKTTTMTSLIQDPLSTDTAGIIHRQTMAHELGHAMGLRHNSKTNSIMHETETVLRNIFLMHEINTVNPSGSA